MLEIVLTVVLCIVALSCLVCALAVKKFRVFFHCALIGFLMLAALSLTRHFLGFGLQFNLYTVCSSCFLGPAGVIGLLFLNLL